MRVSLDLGRNDAGSQVEFRLWNFDPAIPGLVAMHSKSTRPDVRRSDGSYELTFVANESRSHLLEGRVLGRETLRWVVDAETLAPELDLGSVTPRAAGVVRGRVEGLARIPLSQGWWISARLQEFATPPRLPAAGEAAIDSETAEFVIEGLPSGRYAIELHSPYMGVHSGGSIEIDADRENEVTIDYRGPDARSIVGVKLNSVPFRSLQPDLECVALIAADGTAFHPVAVPSAGSTCLFTDLPGAPGDEYELRVTDERFAEIVHCGVRRGDALTVILQGRATLVMDVYDELTGEPVLALGLEAVYRDADGRDSSAMLLAAGGVFLPGMAVPGIPVKDLVLEIRRNGHDDVLVAVDRLAPGEVRRISVGVPCGGILAGRVREPSGRAPASGGRVLVRRGAGESSIGRYDRLSADGSFLFVDVPTGEWAIEVTGPSGSTVRGSLEAFPGKTAAIEVTLPQPGAVRGRLRSRSGSFAGIDFVRLRMVGSGKEREQLLVDPVSAEVREARIGVDGTFFVEGLANAEYAVAVGMTPLEQDFCESVHVRDVGSVLVRPGETIETEFSVDPILPVRVNFTVTDRGGMPDALEVHGWSDEHECGALLGLLDASGQGAIVPLFPGEWEFVLRPRDRAWFWSLPLRAKLESRRNTGVMADVDVDIGTLRLIDAATRLPIGDRAVSWVPRREGFAFPSAEGLTDGDGRLRFRAIPGDYILWVEGGERREWKWVGSVMVVDVPIAMRR